MERELAQIVVGLLTGSADFTGVMGNRLFPLIADEGTPMPFAIYRVDESDSETKDNAGRFVVSVTLVFSEKNYLNALELKAKIQDLFLQSEYTFMKYPSITEYHDETKSVIAEVNFEAIY